MLYDVGVATDRGRREINEDRFLAVDLSNGTWFVAVADGVGGQPHGEVASEEAMTRLLAMLKKWKTDTPPETLADTIDVSLRKIHDGLLAKGRKQSDLKGMATTFCCAYLLGGGAIHRYAGDSMLWWVRDGEVKYRSKPHANDSGIWSCLGGPSPPQLSPIRQKEYDWLLHLKSGDTVVLNTDGLLHSLAEPTLLGMFEQPGPAQELADRLVQAAVKAGEQDNITVVAVRVLPDAD